MGTNNWLDNIIRFFSPSLYYERQQARVKTAVLEGQTRYYQAATKGRRGANWGDYGEDDPNHAVGMALRTIRNRSRALYNNNGNARKAVNTIALNVVGKGIRPAPKGGSKTSNKRVKEYWKMWANSKACDFNGRKTMYALQYQAARSMAMDGECLIIKRRTSSGLLPFQLQVLGAEHLDRSKDTIDINMFTGGNEDGTYITQGVEFDSDGRRVAYWIFDRPPSSQNARSYTSKRIEAENVIHLYEEIRPGQVRGVPFLVAALLKLRDLDDFQDAELMRKKVAACFSVFVTQSPTLTPSQSSQDERLEKVEPGIIEHLAPGETVSFAAPPAAEGYEEYNRSLLQGIASAAGISYEAISGDLSKVNFSSGRMGWLEAWKQAEHWQHHVFIPLFCQTVWQWFNEGMIQMNLLRQPVFAEWTPQGRYMIDPAKEVKGITAALASGLTSWSEAARQQGHDPETLLAQMVEDMQEMESKSIKLDWMPEDEPEEDSENGA